VIPSAGHLFYVADVSSPVLDDADAHHAARVLRLRDGEALTVGDGAGRWRRARWVGRGIEPDGDVATEAPPARPVAVGFALVKGSKPELVVQKLTELGVDRIVPFTAARSVVRWDPSRAERAQARLAATARQAGMQSRRAWLPALDEVSTFDGALDALPDVALADRGGRPLHSDDSALLVGPEGGWDPAERADRDAVALADGVLRAETAAVVAGALLTAFRSGRFQRGG
jgi:16S rRNA (uracil1498-N3)-methyltransferase